MIFNKQCIKVLSDVIVGLTVLTATATATAQNIALHKTVIISPTPNASQNKNNDPQLLTDGIYASTGGVWSDENQKLPLWQQAGTLGWRLRGRAILTIDLGSVQPISGVIYSTGAGGKSKEGWTIPWPKSIYIATSNDNETWHYVGDLVRLSAKSGTPPDSGDANFRYITNNLKTHGRYISLGVVGYPYIFADEVEVLRGNDSFLNDPAGMATQSMEEFVLQNQITDKARQRQNDDIDAIRALLKEADISAEQKSTFEARLNEDATATKNMPLQPVDFETIIPLSDTHRNILSIHGESLQLQGFKPLTVWKQHRYAWLPLINKPEVKQRLSIELSMLKNEIRSDSVLLTNASAKPMTVKVQLPDTGAKPDWLQLSHIIWTDTLGNNPVHSALMPLQVKDGFTSFEIPAGITGKLWVTLDASKLPVGTHKSTFVISGGGEKIQVPMSINISKTVMDRPRLSLTMWDFTHDETSRYGINAQTMPAAIEMMQSHFVDTPVASGFFGILSPQESDFDANNYLKPHVKLDFTRFDRWINRWPNARYYLIYHTVNPNFSFAGKKMGTPEFNARFGSYIKAIADHAKNKLGIKPSQLLITFKDEPHDNEGNITLVGQARALKSVAPEVSIFSNPQWPDPTTASDQEAFLLPDILCTSGNYAMDFYEKLRRDHGKELWFYTTPPGVHAKDPQAFYRAYAWNVYSMNGNGMGWWSFGDSRTTTSWNAYNSAFGGYTPAFLDQNNVYGSVHWDAVREGVEDFEILSMLNDTIQKLTNQPQKQQAQRILDNAVAAVKDTYSKGRWSAQMNPFVVDAELDKVRMELARLGPK